MDQIAVQNKRIATKVDQLYTNDLIRMQTTLEKFDLPKVGPDGTDGLERRFLHTMVALLDDRSNAIAPHGCSTPLRSFQSVPFNSSS